MQQGQTILTQYSVMQQCSILATLFTPFLILLIHSLFHTCIATRSQFFLRRYLFDLFDKHNNNVNQMIRETSVSS
jgi:uncharacterized membrane protein